MTADDACNTLACPELATKLVHWPGATKRFCHGCSERAKGIAEAMGFALTIEAIPAPQPAPVQGGARPAIDLNARAPYEKPAIAHTATFEPDGTACRECGSDLGFCAPQCASQGKD